MIILRKNKKSAQVLLKKTDVNHINFFIMFLSLIVLNLYFLKIKYYYKRKVFSNYKIKKKVNVGLQDNTLQLFYKAILIRNTYKIHETTLCFYKVN